MADSDIAIVNSALLLIADETISSLDDSAKVAKICKIKWPLVRDAVLASDDWNCARSRSVLLRDTVVPVFGYAYQYSLPMDPYFLVGRYIQFQDGEFFPLVDNRFGGEIDPDYVFSIEGRKLLTDAESVNLVYTSRITDPTLYSAYLLDVFMFKLAAEIAYNITGSTSLVESLTAKLKDAFKLARAKNGQEGVPRIPKPSILTVRR